MRISDWSSDVCSSDLVALAARQVEHLAEVDFQEILRDGKRAPEIEPPMPAVGEESPAQAAVGDVVDAAEIAKHLRRGHAVVAPAARVLAVEGPVPALRFDDAQAVLESLPGTERRGFGLGARQSGGQGKS